MDGVQPESIHEQFPDHGCRSGIELPRQAVIVEHERTDL